MRRETIAKHALGWALSILILAALLLGAEWLARGVLARQGHTAWPLLFASAGEGQPYQGAARGRQTLSLPTLDPHLGFAQERAAGDARKTMPGFVVHGVGAEERLNRIVALGGSTTDPIVAASWPEQLAGQMHEAGYRVLVYNGGVAGYSSAQELLKLLRDGLIQEPHVVASLNGINDLGFLHAVPGHPMVHPYQVRVLEAAAGQRPFPLLPNVSALAKHWIRPRAPHIHLGPHNGASPFDQWQRNVRSMQALCAEFGVAYRCFLQPVLGVGEYAPTAAEDALLERTQAQHAGRRDYLGELGAFYGPARAFAAKTPWCTDLTDLFAGQSGVYHDARHLRPGGNAQVAAAVLDVLRKDGLIRRNVPEEWQVP